MAANSIFTLRSVSSRQMVSLALTASIISPSSTDTLVSTMRGALVRFVSRSISISTSPSISPMSHLPPFHLRGCASEKISSSVHVRWLKKSDSPCSTSTPVKSLVPTNHIYCPYAKADKRKSSGKSRLSKCLKSTSLLISEMPGSTMFSPLPSVQI